ncbi:LOB domain-containing protein 27 [Euphorbia peplus]|nr:LOB domain-containing protein 27 [Euphorbia peplus]
MTHKGGTSQACAACKFQRRKCSSDCPLAPYFPPDQPKMFQNAHKLFGVRKIVKIIEALDPPRKQEAMQSIIYQSNIRDKFPVHGCWGIICQLTCQIKQAQEELFAVNAQLEMYRSQNHNQNLDHNDDASQLVLGMAPPSNENPVFGYSNCPPPPQGYNNLPVSQNLSYSNTSYIDSSNDCLWFQNPNNPSKNDNAMSIQPSTNQQQHQLFDDYDEIHHPFIYSIDDRQSYIDQEAYQSSSEESLKDTTQCIEQHVADTELKNAAACFSLTSVN